MPAQAHAEDDAPPEEAGPEKPEPAPPAPPGSPAPPDAPDEEEPAPGTYDDGRFEPL